jgi:hypothetical protein
VAGRLELLLIFATGLDTIPPLGFEPTPSLTFGHGEDVAIDDIRRQFPIAHTCTNSLRIPLIATYDKFKENMNAALDMVNTFTIA